MKDYVCKKGTHQGGILSPLLCNIVLHGIEDLWNEPSKYWLKKEGRFKIKKNHIVLRGFRYADDMIFCLKEDEEATELRSKIDKFLKDRELKVKEAKTQLVTSTDGFDFLGWKFEVKANRALTCYLSKKNRRQMIEKIKDTIKDSKFDIRKKLNKAKSI